VPVGADPAVLGNVEHDPIGVLELALEVAVPLVAEVEEELAAGRLDAPLRLGEVVDLKAEMVGADRVLAEPISIVSRPTSFISNTVS
jgi:hypothetical protein